jgi:hypothetical protein
MACFLTDNFTTESYGMLYIGLLPVITGNHEVRDESKAARF